MANKLTTSFDSYEFLNPDEYRDACTLNIGQRQLIQTLLAQCAEEQLGALPGKEENLTDEDYLRRLFYNRGMIDAYRSLLNLDTQAVQTTTTDQEGN